MTFECPVIATKALSSLRRTKNLNPVVRFLRVFCVLRVLVVSTLTEVYPQIMYNSSFFRDQ